MAVSRDMGQFQFSQQTCLYGWLALLPLMYVRVEPFTAAPVQVLVHDQTKGEIRAQAEAVNAEGLCRYRYKFNCEAISANSCKVHIETSTHGLTDVGLGQLTLRQLLLTFDLSLSGKLPPGHLPLFLLKPVPPQPDTSEGRFQATVNQAFALSKRGQAEQALALFEEALSLQPNAVEAHFHAGVLLMLLGYLAESATAFKRVIKLEPHHLMARPYYEDVKKRLAQK